MFCGGGEGGGAGVRELDAERAAPGGGVGGHFESSRSVYPAFSVVEDGVVVCCKSEARSWRSVSRHLGSRRIKRCARCPSAPSIPPPPGVIAGQGQGQGGSIPPTGCHGIGSD